MKFELLQSDVTCMKLWFELHQNFNGSEIKSHQRCWKTIKGTHSPGALLTKALFSTTYGWSGSSWTSMGSSGGASTCIGSTAELWKFIVDFSMSTLRQIHSRRIFQSICRQFQDLRRDIAAFNWKRLRINLHSGKWSSPTWHKVKVWNRENVEHWIWPYVGHAKYSSSSPRSKTSTGSQKTGNSSLARHSCLVFKNSVTSEKEVKALNTFLIGFGCQLWHMNMRWWWNVLNREPCFEKRCT